MMERVVLPINIRPDIRAYMSHVTIFSILDLKDFAEDILFADPVYLVDEAIYNADNISMNQQQVEVQRKGKEFILSSKQHIEKKHVNFYWESLNAAEGVLEFTLQFKQRLDVFQQLIVQVKQGYYIALYSNGQVRVVSDKYQDDFFLEHNLVDMAARLCFEFSKNYLKISYTILDHSSEPKGLCTVSTDFSVQSLNICLAPACHPAYNILYNNFIQLSMPINTAGLIYCHGIGEHKIFDNVLKNFELNQDYLDEYPSRLSFIKGELKKGNYVGMPADEYYVPNRAAYGNYHYIHGNVIYAFDDEKQTINMLGYKDSLEDSKVPYEEAEKALTSENIKKQYYNDFMIHRKNYRCYPEYFNLKTVIRTLKEYRDGTDTYAHYGNLERHNVKEGRVYGLNIYDEILKKEDVFQSFMHDRRCSYIMTEHKMIMLKRLSYFYDTGILKKKDYTIHKENYENLYRLSERMCLLILKNKIKNREENYEKVREYLKKMKTEETIILDALIRDLGRREWRGEDNVYQFTDAFV